MFLFTIFRDIHLSCNNYMFYDKGNNSHKSTSSKVLVRNDSSLVEVYAIGHKYLQNIKLP